MPELQKPHTQRQERLRDQLGLAGGVWLRHTQTEELMVKLMVRSTEGGSERSEGSEAQKGVRASVQIIMLRAGTAALCTTLARAGPRRASHPAVAAPIQRCDGPIQVGPPVSKYAPAARPRAEESRALQPTQQQEHCRVLVLPCHVAAARLEPARASIEPHSIASWRFASSRLPSKPPTSHPALSSSHSARSKVAVTKPSTCLSKRVPVPTSATALAGAAILHRT